MELRHLRYFVMVGETLNLSKASKRLHVSQPALSRQIKDLEEELGATLFSRHPNGVELTPAGRLFLSRAQDILRKTNSAVREVETTRRGQQRALRIGFDPGAVNSELLLALQGFGTGHAAIRLCLQERERADLLRLIQEEEMDLALIAGSAESLPADVDYQLVSRHKLKICIGQQHPFASSPRLNLEEMKCEPLIILKSTIPCNWQQTILSVCRRAGFEPQSVIHVSSQATLLGLIAAKRGFTLFPDGVWAYETCEAVRSISLTEPLFWTIGAAWRRESAYPLRDSFLSELRNQTQGFGGQLVAFG